MSSQMASDDGEAAPLLRGALLDGSGVRVTDVDVKSAEAHFMGVYAPTSVATPDVYTMLGHANRHLYLACNGKWWFSDTADMAVRNAGNGVIVSMTSAGAPAGLTWKTRTRGPVPALKVEALDAAELAAEKARVAALVLAANAVRAVKVEGHVGERAHAMGVYEYNAEHSPKNGANVFSLVADSDDHLYRATNDRWVISRKQLMMEGSNAGFVASSSGRDQFSPLNCRWEFLPQDKTRGWTRDPQLVVVELALEDDALGEARKRLFWKSRAVDVAVIAFALLIALCFKPFYADWAWVTEGTGGSASGAVGAAVAGAEDFNFPAVEEL